MRSQWLIRFSLVAVAALCLLNINGFLFMLIDKGQVVSGALLILCAALLVVGNHVVAPNAARYSALVIAFVLVSLVFSGLRGIPFDAALVTGPVGNIIIVVAISSGLLKVGRDGAETLTRQISWITFLVAITVFLSPWIYSFYTNPPPDTGRYSGPFANPNEAAMVCCVGVALAFDRHVAERRAIYILMAAICAFGVIATFSKAGMATLVAIYGYAILASPASRKSAFKSLLLVAAVALAAGAFSQIAVELDQRQMRRLEAFMQLLRLNIDENTSSNRNYVWAAALNQIEGQWFIFGGGLGSMREIVGGLFEDGVWRGAHNFWLVILGEAGALVLIPFLMFSALLVEKALVNRIAAFSIMGILIVVFVDTFASHNILELRFYAFLLGFVIGVLRIYERQQSRGLASG